MTKLYADGRPAEQGGRQVKYDAGGTPHVMPQAVEPPMVATVKTTGTEAMYCPSCQMRTTHYQNPSAPGGWLIFVCVVCGKQVYRDLPPERTVPDAQLQDAQAKDLGKQYQQMRYQLFEIRATLYRFPQSEQETRNLTAALLPLIDLALEG